MKKFLENIEFIEAEHKKVKISTNKSEKKIHLSSFSSKSLKVPGSDRSAARLLYMLLSESNDEDPDKSYLKGRESSFNAFSNRDIKKLHASEKKWHEYDSKGEKFMSLGKLTFPSMEQQIVGDLEINMRRKGTIDFSYDQKMMTCNRASEDTRGDSVSSLNEQSNHQPAIVKPSIFSGRRNVDCFEDQVKRSDSPSRNYKMKLIDDIDFDGFEARPRKQPKPSITISKADTLELHDDLEDIPCPRKLSKDEAFAGAYIRDVD